MSSRNLLPAFLFSALIVFSFSAYSASGYSELLQNCGKAIAAKGYSGAEMKLAKKVNSGARYKFWIDVTTLGEKENATVKFYCEGKKRSAIVEKIEIKT